MSGKIALKLSATGRSTLSVPKQRSIAAQDTVQGAVAIPVVTTPPPKGGGFSLSRLSFATG
ncbi:hypothetical protein ACWCYZ_42920, partial [Streptomyces virginiae]